MYTQRGRLTQDDAARELKQQRSIGSAAHLAAVEEGRNSRGWPRAMTDAARGAETSGDNAERRHEEGGSREGEAVEDR